MAQLDVQTLLDSLPSVGGTPAGFQQAQNALQRSRLSGDYPEQLRRLEHDFTQFDLPDLASGQAARGAFHSGATQRKGQRLGEAFARGTGDITRGATYGLAGLKLSDIGSSIPGVSF